MMPMVKVKFGIVILGLILTNGCGVKGDPLPPEKAPRLGRGHPTYSKASEEVTQDFDQIESKKEKKDKK